MGEPWETILRFAIIGGIAVAVWNFNTSMERIATALTRIADQRPKPDGGEENAPG